MYAPFPSHIAWTTVANDCLSFQFMGPGMGELAGKVSMIMANWMGLWLWGLALWFFIVSVGAHWSTVRHGRGKFAMTFYSYIFPNTGRSFCPPS